MPRELYASSAVSSEGATVKLGVFQVSTWWVSWDISADEKTNKHGSLPTKCVSYNL